MASTPKNSAKLCFDRDFTLRKWLGEGAYGKVALCRSNCDYRDYAVKCIWLGDDYYMEDALKEYVHIKDVKHENLVKIFSSWSEQVGQMTILYFQMEYCDGGTLKDAIEIGALRYRLPKVKNILRGSLCGLQFLHERGLIHRDIKPANIVMTKYFPKIADFGLITPAMLTAKSLTAGVGTEFYMAPEVPLSSYTNKIDIFSLGITFLELFVSLGVKKCEEQRLTITSIRVLIFGEAKKKEFKDFLRGRRGKSLLRKTHQIPPSFGGKIDKYSKKAAWQLVENMTEETPEKRLSAAEILAHLDFANICNALGRQQLNKREQQLIALGGQQLNEGTKCVLVGDAASGKTSMANPFSSKALGLALSQLYDDFESEWGLTPTRFENYYIHLEIDGTTRLLVVWDTAGIAEFDQIRPLCYPQADVIVLCFSVGRHSSFENVTEKWLREIRYHLPDAPIVLVGTMTDIRDDPNEIEALRKVHQYPLTTKDGQRLARSIGAASYLECSAKTFEGVSKIFLTALVVALDRTRNTSERKRSSRCEIL